MISITRSARSPRTLQLLPIAVLFALLLPGCQLVKGIFEAGVFVGVASVVLVVGLLLWGVLALLKR